MTNKITKTIIISLMALVALPVGAISLSLPGNVNVNTDGQTGATVTTPDININAGQGSATVKTPGVDINADGNGATIKTPNGTISANANGATISAGDIKINADLKNGAEVSVGGMKIKADKDGATIDDGNGLVVTSSSGITINGNKLFLNEGNQQSAINLLPTKISEIADTMKADIIKTTLDSVGKLPFYDLTVKEPFKLFNFIPMDVNSDYTINAQDSTVIGVKSPWFTFLGSTGSFRENLKKAIEDAIK